MGSREYYAKNKVRDRERAATKRLELAHESHALPFYTTPAALRELQPDANLTQLARHTGLSLSYVSRIFSGLRYPSDSAILAMAEYLNVPPGKLRDVLATIPPTLKGRQ